MSKTKRVVVTGMGIVSSIGNNVETVKNSLMNQKSGIVSSDIYREMGFRSQIHGEGKINLEDHIDKKQLRFMGAGAAYSVLSMEQAIADAGLTNEEVSNPRTGLIAGSGGPSTANLLQAFDVAREKGPKRVGPFMVPRCMSSSVSACIATFFKIKGVNFSITSACSTSAHCIGIGADQIKYGNQDIVFAGGGEELDWTLSVLFDAMGAMSSKYNNTPELASRPYDVNRDGFVIAGGGGMLVLEELEHAKARGAKIYGEIVGHCANSDGFDMVAPSGEGAIRCMKQALANTNKKVDYIFSSHCLEHLNDWVGALDHWTTRLHKGGIIFLYLPHPDQEYWKPWSNRKHIHLLEPTHIKDYFKAKNFSKVFVTTGYDLNHSYYAVAEL